VSQDPTAYTNVRLLDPATGLDNQGALLVQDGIIVDFGPDLQIPGKATIVDCSGLCLSPGLIDIRVHLREPGEEHKETIETAGLAAATGGVTAMVCLPNTVPAIDDVPVVEFIARRAREAKLVKVYSYGTVTRGGEGEQLTEMGLLSEAGAVAFTDGTKAIADATVMRRALSYASGFDLLIVQHPEEPSLARDGAMNEGEVATRLGLPGIPSAAEPIMIERDIRLVELTGGRYHAAHVSTAEGVDIIRKAKKRGLNVTCDTAPHYFALNENAVGEYRSFAKLSPPLRSEDDRLAIVAGLADGTIDVIASDHTPQDQDSKRLPFIQAECGAIGLETLLPLTLELVHNGSISLLDALAKITSEPANLFKLPGGKLQRGGPADIVLFDPDKPWILREENFRSKSKNAPYDGRPVQGQVHRTIVDGRTVYELGS
jgi:dihydroorotase